MSGFRTILSGIGGDEVLGGTDTSPELAAYLASGQFSLLVRRATEWSLVSRDPLRATIWNTLRYAHRLYWLPTKANRAIPFWFTPRLRRYCFRSTDLAERISGLGRGPVAVHNAQTWSSMLESERRLMKQTSRGTGEGTPNCSVGHPGCPADSLPYL